VSGQSEAKQGVSSRIRFFGPDMADSAPLAIDRLGGKGINLFKMTLAKFPVPPGFVVTTEAYHHFVAENKLGEKVRKLAESINRADVKSVENISAAIRALFAESPVPAALAAEIKAAYLRLKNAGGERVAVRSSATAEDLAEASFAGQQDTYLNIRGEEALMKAVRSCWGSLWTARAVAYRAKQGISMEGLGLAVVVQQMVIADAAGVMFTVNPVTGARKEIVINAAWGLGEAIVGGHVEPDSIIADKATGKIKDLKVSEKAVMTVMTEHGTEERELKDDRRHARVLQDADVLRLVETGRLIENHYGTPQDIEWALAGGKLYLLQSRPVTSLPEDPEDVERVRLQEVERLKKIAGNERRVWILHNLSETLPAPTPLTWDIVGEFMTGRGGFGRMYRDLGYTPGKRVCEQGFLDLICGRIYADPDRAAELFCENSPFAYDLEALAKDPKLMDAAPAKFVPERVGGRLLVTLPKFMRQMSRAGKIMAKARKEVLNRFENEILPPYLAWVREKRNQNLQKMTTAQLLDELDARADRVLQDFGGESLKPGFFGAVAEAGLTGLLTQLMGKEEGMQLSLALTQGLEGDTTIEQAAAMFDVARGDLTLAEFIERYGHRAVEEMELSRPRWREDRFYVTQILNVYLDQTVRSPRDIHRANEDRRIEMERKLPEILAQWGGSVLLEDLLVDLKDAQKMLPYRESGKHYLMMGYETIRQPIMELASRWKLDRDIFFLERKELREFESRKAEWMALVASRKTAWLAAKKMDMNDVVDSNTLDTLGLPEKLDSASELKGDPIASGNATGVAQLVKDPSETAGLCTDYVLVCHSTDPAWTALFVHARALVVEKGGVLSHGAIVARDYGIPAVVCPGAMRKIPHDALIRVDGNRGVITILGADRK
jgi:pyruvate,water dikinase